MNSTFKSQTLGFRSGDSSVLTLRRSKSRRRPHGTPLSSDASVLAAFGKTKSVRLGCLRLKSVFTLHCTNRNLFMGIKLTGDERHDGQISEPGHAHSPPTNRKTSPHPKREFKICTRLVASAWGSGTSAALVSAPSVAGTLSGICACMCFYIYV